MFITRTEVINHLVAHGKPANIARAFTNEYLNWDYDGETSDLIRQYEGETPLVLTAERVDILYEDFLGYGIELTADGITFDGELLFDVHGNYLPR